MTDLHSTAPLGPTTEEGFLADRLTFWHSFTRFTTYVAAFLIALLAILWWTLV